MSKQPDAMFIRHPQAEQPTGAWLAGYLLMMTWPTGAKARKQLLSRVTDNLMHPDIPRTIAPAGNALLWADNGVHQFDEEENLSRVRKATVLQLIIRDIGSNSLSFETHRLPTRDDELEVREQVVAGIREVLDRD
jgi:hypothetical protein